MCLPKKTKRKPITISQSYKGLLQGLSFYQPINWSTGRFSCKSCFLDITTVLFWPRFSPHLTSGPHTAWKDGTWGGPLLFARSGPQVGRSNTNMSAKGWPTFVLCYLRLTSILVGATQRPEVTHHCLKWLTSVYYMCWRNQRKKSWGQIEKSLMAEYVWNLLVM